MTCILVLITAAPLRAQEPQDHWRVLPEERVEQNAEAYQHRMAAPPGIRAASRAEWQERREAVRQHVLDCLGLWPLPDRVDLDVRYGGAIEREGYTIRRVYWQTFPGFYASGYLYTPAPIEGRLPAVLHPHGHWANGAKEPVVQSRCIALALKGYVALSVESFHGYDYYSGLTPMTVMQWSNMRAVDLLQSLPYVDASRIGSTGCSGGGQQTLYMMCLDDRIQAAVPVCLVSEFRRILSTEFAHCACNHVPGLLRGTDEPEIGACFAPRPALYVCLQGPEADWTQWFPQEGYPDILSVYRLLGARDRLQCRQFEWHHDYGLQMREAMYAWMDRWLKGEAPSASAPEPQHETETLQALAALDADIPEARGLPAAIEEVRARRRYLRAAPDAGPEVKRAALGELFGIVPDGPPDAEILRTQEAPSLRTEWLAIRGEPDVEVPAVLLLPPGAARVPLVVVAAPEGKSAFLSAEWEAVEALLLAQVAVLALDVRYYGELGWHRDVLRLNGIVLGRPPAAVGTTDLLAGVEYASRRPEVDGERIGVVGLGEAGALVVFAGALRPGLRVAAPELGSLYEEDREPTACHLVTIGDLPEIAALCGRGTTALSGAEHPESYEGLPSLLRPPSPDPQPTAACLAELCRALQAE